MSLFKQHFLTVLVKEAEEPTAPAPEAAQAPEGNPDETAWQNSLEPGTNPEDFKAAANPEFGVVSQNLGMVKEWVKRVEDFRHFINGLDGDSLNAQINKLDRAGSVFKGLVRSEENRIIRIAEDLAGLSEVFKAYMIGADKKVRDMKER
jgi:hypothetical protein